MKSADELTYGAGAVAGRFEFDKCDSGVEAAKYLTSIRCGGDRLKLVMRHLGVRNQVPA